MVGLYTDILDTSAWVNYSSSAFSCGKYSLDYYVKNSLTKFSNLSISSFIIFINFNE